MPTGVDSVPRPVKPPIPVLSAIRKSASTAPDQICDIRLGQEVTLAYLKGKDAESEEAQEHANNSSLALYA
jgi:hypothetical protein